MPDRDHPSRNTDNWRATRAYLDVASFHPYDDGNARFAGLVLQFVLLPPVGALLSGSRFTVGGLEEFDEITGGVGEQDLASAGAGDDVATERQPGAA